MTAISASKKKSTLYTQSIKRSTSTDSSLATRFPRVIGVQWIHKIEYRRDFASSRESASTVRHDILAYSVRLL